MRKSKQGELLLVAFLHIYDPATRQLKFLSSSQIFLVTGSGQLEFEEFCTLAARFLVEEDTEAMQQELREAFRLYDKEGNGYITTEVFRDILHELDDKLTPQELDMMIEEIDADGSGTLDFDGRRSRHRITIFTALALIVRE